MSAATSANENCTACADVILSAVNPGRCAGRACSNHGCRRENAFPSMWPTRYLAVADALWMHGILKINIDPV